MCSQVSTHLLLGFNCLEESFEVAGTEALMVATLDHLHEEGWSVLQRLCEDLEEVTLVIVVDQNLKLTDGFNILCNFGAYLFKSCDQVVVVGIGDRL